MAPKLESLHHASSNGKLPHSPLGILSAIIPLAGLAFFAGFKVFNLRRILGDTEDVMLILFAVGFVFAIVAFAESVLRKCRLLLPLLGLSFYLVVLLLVFAVFVKATFEIDAAGGSR
jgi:hypothetical protein